MRKIGRGGIFFKLSSTLNCWHAVDSTDVDMRFVIEGNGRMLIK